MGNANYATWTPGLTQFDLSRAKVIKEDKVYQGQGHSKVKL